MLFSTCVFGKNGLQKFQIGICIQVCTDSSEIENPLVVNKLQQGDYLIFCILIRRYKVDYLFAVVRNIVDCDFIVSQ